MQAGWPWRLCTGLPYSRTPQDTQVSGISSIPPTMGLVQSLFMEGSRWTWACLGQGHLCPLMLLIQARASRRPAEL